MLDEKYLFRNIVMLTALGTEAFTSLRVAVTDQATAPQDRLACPTELVGSMDKSSQLPIVVGADSDTTGSTGLAGALRITVAASLLASAPQSLGAGVAQKGFTLPTSR